MGLSMRSIGLAGLAALVAAALLSRAATANVQPAAAPQSALTAEQVVERNAEARGGLAKWRAIHNMVWTGQMEGGSADLPAMQFLLMQARPNKTRFEVNALGQHSLRVFDGTQGWKERPGRGGATDAQPYSAQENRYAQDEAVIDGPLIDSAARGSRVTLVGLEQVDGHAAYHLDVVGPTGQHEGVWVDASTFLESRYDRLSWTHDGKAVDVSVRYGDYRDFDGVKIPTKIDIGGADGNPGSRMLVEHVQLDAELDPRAFASPLSPRHRPGRSTHAERGGAGLGNTLPSWALGQAATKGSAPQAGRTP